MQDLGMFQKPKAMGFNQNNREKKGQRQPCASHIRTEDVTAVTGSRVKM
jgi:hypothetical protein